MMRRLHLALFLLLIGMGSAALEAATQASVSGVVRDSSGAPQFGAEVQLLRSDLSVISSAYTNSEGRFVFRSVLPGHYAVKAMGTSFLPSLRENLHVRSNTVVNLTLNTLYEVMQWLPAQPRSKSAQKDDWTWTLRTAANRPLLRWLEDGPLVVVSDGPNAAPKLKARLIAAGHEGTFGEDGQRISVELENTPSDSRELLARVDFDPSSDAGMESMLGFRQDLGFAGSVQSVAAVALHPEIESDQGGGLQEIALRSSQSMNMGDEFVAEAGAEQVMARFAQGSSNTLFATLPFLHVGWRKDDNTTIAYRLATAVPQIADQDGSHAAAMLPAVSMREGNLVLERGLHQEIGWERTTDNLGMAVVFYSDSLQNPALEAASRVGNSFSSGVLIDGSSGLVRSAGKGYSSTGVVATMERRLPHGNSIRLSYANGSALTMASTVHPVSLLQTLAATRPHRAQMYSLSLSGTLDGTGTRWRASYRWQPEDTITRIAPFSADAAEPFFNLHLRQPVCRRHREGIASVAAMVDLHNLLAQGYRPFVLTDGSLLVFAQDQRSLSAGLAFTF